MQIGDDLFKDVILGRQFCRNIISPSLHTTDSLMFNVRAAQYRTVHSRVSTALNLQEEGRSDSLELATKVREVFTINLY